MCEISVYPRPQWLRDANSGAFALSSATPLVATEGVVAEVGHFQRWMHEDHGLNLAVGHSGDHEPEIRVGLLSDDPARSMLAHHGYRPDGREDVAEGYFLGVGSDHVVLAGHDAAGVLHGLQLLRQLVVRSDDRLVIQPVEAHDWPYKSIRGIHLYMPPREQLPFFRSLRSLFGDTACCHRRRRGRSWAFPALDARGP